MVREVVSPSFDAERGGRLAFLRCRLNDALDGVDKSVISK